PLFAEFVKSMRDLGYIEGKNVVLDWRFAEGKEERYPQLAAELVASKPDVLVSHGTPPVKALQHATRTVPIVMIAAADPVAAGFAKTLARPGGNITGTTNNASETGPKQLQMLKIVVPQLKRVGVVTNPRNAVQSIGVKDIQSAAKS